jgi:hypothetical protein
MPLTDAGLSFVAQAVVDDTPTHYDNTNAYIGVGDSSTAFNSAQTDLQAASNKLRKAMQATYPTRSSAQMVFQSLYGSTDANFAWNEWGIFNHASAGTMLVRKVANMGTKQAGQSWRITATVTVSHT